MAQRTKTCTACHGDQGRAGPDGYYPRLAGKPVGYLYHQLINFTEGRRHYTLMTGLLDNLTPEYLQEIAHYFSSLSIPYPAPLPTQASAAVLARGEQLVREGDPARNIPACRLCHGKALTGVRPNIPGLLGLPGDYINGQLGGWQTGQRSTVAPDCMAKIARLLNDGDISAVARWLSAQPVPVDAKAVDQPPAQDDILKNFRCGSAP
jgi:cytochrome c553